MAVLEQLAAFVAEARWDDVPEAARDALRLHVFDTLVALRIGVATAEGQAAAALVTDVAADGPACLPGLGLRAPAPLAALAGCAAARCTEIDDIHLESCTTPGAVVVPTALAVAQHPAADPEACLMAALVGYEVVTRFGRAVDGPTILYRGVWPTYLAAGLGAAAVAARLLGLSAAQTADALAAALMLATGTTARGRAPAARWLAVGCAAQNGVLAALGARRGFHGDLALLDGGWSRATGIALDPAPLAADLGVHYAIERVSLKPYCSAKQATAAIAGLVALLAETGLPPDGIERVTVAVPPAYAPMIDQPAPARERLATIVSAPYQLALAALYPDELRDVRRPTLHHDEPAFQAFMARVAVVPEPALAAYYPAAWPARVTVRASDREWTREVRATWGDPGQPPTWAEVEAKAQAVLAGVVAPAAVARLAATCRALGAPAGLADLLAACGADWRSPAL